MKIKSVHFLFIMLVVSLLFSAGCAIIRGAAFTIGDRSEYHYVDPIDNNNYFFFSATSLLEYKVIKASKKIKAGEIGVIHKGGVLGFLVDESVHMFDDVLANDMLANALMSHLIASDESNSSMPSILVKYPIDHRGYESPYIIWDGRNTNGDKTNSTIEAGDIPWIYYKAISVGLNHKGFNIVRLTPSPLKSKDFPVQLEHHDFEAILKNTIPDYILEVNILKTKRRYLRESVWDLPYQDFELTTELKIYDAESKKLISESIVKSIKPDVAGNWIPTMFMPVLENHFSDVMNHSIFESLEKIAQN